MGSVHQCKKAKNYTPNLGKRKGRQAEKERERERERKREGERIRAQILNRAFDIWSL